METAKSAIEGRAIKRLLWGLLAAAGLALIITSTVVGLVVNRVAHERSEVSERKAGMLALAELIDRTGARTLDQLKLGFNKDRTLAGSELQVQSLLKLKADLAPLAQADVRAAKALTEQLKQVEELYLKAKAWIELRQKLNSELVHQESSKAVRKQIEILSSKIDSLEGQARLARARLIRELSDPDTSSGPQAGSKLISAENSSGRAFLHHAGSEIAELALLSEILSHESNTDRLNSLKDNEFKPSLERLERSLIGLDAHSQDESLGNSFNELKVALFGSGHAIDRTHQTIRTGQGGLFNVRLQLIDLQSKQHSLEEEIQNLNLNWQREVDALRQHASTFIEQTAQSMESQLHTIWRYVITIAILAVLILLFLGLWVLRHVNAQVQRLTATREAALAASQAKGQFLANMSHELRTPLNGLIGMTDLVLDTKLTDEQRDFLTTAKSSGELLLSIIGDILDFSKIEAGKLVFAEEPFNLAECLESVRQMVEAQVRAKELQIVWDVVELDGRIIGDANRLKQVLMNLLSNAIKFTSQHGAIIVRASKDQETENSLLLHFTVSDTGIGIPEHKLETIFDAFSQADNSMTRNYGGTGLGLTIARRLVELMSGKIWVKSKPGVGSTFHFTARFPVEPKSAQLIAAAT